MDKAGPVKPAGLAQIGGGVGGLGVVAGPFVGLADHVELGGHRGSGNAPEFDLQGEEVDVVRSLLVEPVHSGPVFLPDALGYPDDGHSLQTGYIGQDLAQMGVVGLGELVLDEDEIPPGMVLQTISARKSPTGCSVE